MQSGRIKPITRSLRPALRMIQATDNEIIILQAALQHYQHFVGLNQELAQAIPLIQAFIQRLHDQLPARKEEIETP